MNNLPKQEQSVKHQGQEKKDTDKATQKEPILGQAPSAKWHILQENETVLRWD